MPDNLIMPKQTAELDVFYASLKIYYDANGDWVTNNDYKEKIQNLVPRLQSTEQDGAFMVKQSEMTRYFGLVEYDYDNRCARITDSGKRFYEAHQSSNHTEEINLIIQAVVNGSFGRNNTAVKSSNSDVDPPKLFLRAVKDTNEAGGISRGDLAYLIYLTNDLDVDYASAIKELEQHALGQEVPEALINKYTDVKFTKFLENMSIVELVNHKYVLSQEVNDGYSEELAELSIYNHEPESTLSLNTESGITEDADDVEAAEDVNQNKIDRALEYKDLNSAAFISENEREPLIIEVGSREKFRTNPRIAKTALELGGHRCMGDNSHTTFTNRRQKPYMEAHHLVPMSAQRDFSMNIDRIENIVSLCPTCHAAIHRGDEETRRNLLRKLYDLKKSDFESAEIDISFEDLFKNYYQ